MTTMTAASPFRRTLLSWLRIDRGGVAWIPPLRIALVTTLLYLATASDTKVAIPLVIGALLVGVTDPSGSLPLRVRGIGLALITVTIAAAAGSAVSSIPALHVLVAALFAALYGVLGAAGPRAGTAGLVGLVTFAVLAGAPEPLGVVLESTSWIALGGIVQLAAALLPEILGRMEAIRTDLFLAWHGLGIALRDPHHGPFGADATAHVSAARERVAASGESGAARAWLETLVGDAERARIAAIALAAADDLLDPVGKAAVVRLLHAGGDVATRVADSLVLPFTHRRLRRAMERFVAEAQAAEAILPGSLLPVATLLRTALADAVTHATGPWPRGATGLGRLRGVVPHPVLPRPFDPTGVFRRHALRLMVTFAAATVAAILLDLPHAYWLPMTVAWLMKPGFGATTTRLVNRVVGTIAGIAACLAVLALTESPVATGLLLFLATFLACAFIAANYAICTAGVTAIIFAVFVAAGDPVIETAVLRFGLTVAAAGLVLLSILAWRPRMPDLLGERLATQARALRAYADGVLASARDGEAAPAARSATEPLREALIRARLASLTAIETAGVELGAHRIAPPLADQLVHDLVVASAIPAVYDLTGDRGLLGEIGEPALAEIERLAGRFSGTPTPSGSGAAPGPHASGVFASPVVRAHGRLDSAGIQGGVHPAVRGATSGPRP